MSLPGWLQALPDPAAQRALDGWAIEEQGIPGIELMERAGRGLAELVAERVPRGPLAILCGKGNNGGDGLVVARLLRELGREVCVLMVGAAEELQGDAKTNLERLVGKPPQPFSPAALSGVAGVVDAILGTGFSGAARDPAAAAITAINQARAAGACVIACDIPSGVEGASGEVAGAAVRAQATATFHAAKPGLWITPGKDHAGEVRLVDIGIPAGGPGDPAIGLIDASVLGEVPRRGRESTKFAAGSVIVCGGAPGLTGAPCLASRSAMRAGAGYVTACVPASLNQIFETQLLEVMSAAVRDDDGHIALAAVEEVLEHCERADALVLGPGLGRAEGSLQAARELSSRARLPLLLDADGLNAHAGALGSLAAREAPTVLTPHAGELGRLLDVASAEVGERRLEHARHAAQTAQAIVVLKGDDTLVAHPDGQVAISRGGAAALASAGTGDVLSGVIGAYLAKGMDAFTAACAGVFLHASSGRLCAQEIGAEGVIASDVIERLPAARRAAEG